MSQDNYNNSCEVNPQRNFYGHSIRELTDELTKFRSLNITPETIKELVDENISLQNCVCNLTLFLDDTLEALHITRCTKCKNNIRKDTCEECRHCRDNQPNSDNIFFEWNGSDEFSGLPGYIPMKDTGFDF